MTTTIDCTPSSITFAVDDVEPVTTPRDTCPSKEALDRLLLHDGGGKPIEACSEPHARCLRSIYHHPLLAAVHISFAEHRPLVLTPDSIWLTIAQGVAHHMKIHGERLRHRFVSHQNKLRLVVRIDEFVKGSSQNDWPFAFETWNDQIRAHVGDAIYSTLVNDFSTSDATALAASHVVMMDIFERYYEYDLMCGCGIPSITLEGMPADWRRLREKVTRLQAFDLDWWLEHLLPICDQFVRASEGDIDLDHWQAICKVRHEYLNNIINGWVAKLFPYLREYSLGPVRRRNPIFETGEGLQTIIAPSGLSRVPFTWFDLTYPKSPQIYAMEAIAGTIGIAQNPETLALKPVVGWAVREVTTIDALLERLERCRRLVTGFRSAIAACGFRG